MIPRPRLAKLLLAIFLGLGARIAAASSWTIPGAVNTGGLNNTRFVSDFTVMNPGTVATQATISFFPSSSPNSRTVTLNAGETVVYRNIVDSLFGTSGAGALSISSDQPLLLRARTYNTAASGTYGVALPVYEDERLLTAGETGDSLWISQDASGSSGFRTNIAVVFPDEMGGDATVTVYDADGHAAGQKSFSVGSAGFQQFSVGSFAGAVPAGRAQVLVTRGRAAGYAVVNDNVTGDGSLFTFDGLPAGRQDVLINGVARASGRNGTFFRTDGRFYNPTGVDAPVTVAFHASGNSNPNPAAASFTLPAGKVRDVVDVLGTVLGLPVGSSGALRFKSDLPVAILCRTSNVDPLGSQPGTFGSQQKPVQLLSFLNSADAGIAVTGIRQDTAYRTNIGFAAGENGASYDLVLTTAAGATVETASASLGAWGWTQPSVQDLFPSLSIPADATLRVKVIGGSVDVYDSSIDNLSGDSVVTPAALSPAAIPASATIGPLGGSIRSGDGRLTVRIPAGALSSSVAISLETSASNDAPLGAGSSYRLSPGGLAFARPATLVFRYGVDDVDGSAPGSLGLAFKSGNSWFVATGGAVDSTKHTLTVPITSGSPAAAARNLSAHALADPLTEWAPFRCREIYPTEAFLLQAATLNLGILVTGQSSSEGGPGYEVLGAPVNPSGLVYDWYVNGILLGNEQVGVVHAFDQVAQYTAPNCNPVVNPVLVAVKVSNFVQSRWESLQLASRVRILPHLWRFNVTWTVDFSCDDIVIVVGDHLKYTVKLDVDVGDDFKLLGLSDLPKKDHGTATPCPRYVTSAQRISDNDLAVKLVSGRYNPNTKQFEALLDFTLPYLPVYKITERFSGMSLNTPQSPPLSLEEYAATFQEGSNPIPIFGGTFPPVPVPAILRLSVAVELDQEYFPQCH